MVLKAVVVFYGSALRTLIYYLSETNVTVCHWLNAYSLAHPIPKVGMQICLCAGKRHF